MASAVPDPVTEAELPFSGKVAAGLFFLVSVSGLTSFFILLTVYGHLKGDVLAFAGIFVSYYLVRGSDTARKWARGLLGLAALQLVIGAPILLAMIVGPALAKLTGRETEVELTEGPRLLYTLVVMLLFSVPAVWSLSALGRPDIREYCSRPKNERPRFRIRLVYWFLLIAGLSLGLSEVVFERERLLEIEAISQEIQSVMSGIER